MRRLMIVLATVALGGCDRGIDLTNASVDQVAEASKAAPKQQPGRWETTTSLVAMDLGPLAGNPQMADAVKQQIGRGQIVTTCLTAAMAQSPALAELSQLKGSSCRFDRFRMGKGAIEATMRCDRPNGSLRVTQSGSYTPAAFDLTSTVVQGSAGQPATSMTMHVVGKRTGDCTA